MKLIIGLGNPGAEYEYTRHNMGFMALDFFAKKHNLTFWVENKFKAMISSVCFNGNKALLIKPLTYMNLSGESVIRVMQYYKIDVADILVISDDLDSPLGRIRIREKGSSGGHNGLKNIISHIQTEEFKRIKIGIDRNEQIPVMDWVLKKLTEEERSLIQPSLEKVGEAVEEFIKGESFYKISSQYSMNHI